jgi:thiamine phosphate synthase YjbQ (UPF0047 family)
LFIADAVSPFAAIVHLLSEQTKSADPLPVNEARIGRGSWQQIGAAEQVTLNAGT